MAADGSDEAVPKPALTERERSILAFEQQWWKLVGSKEQAIRDEFAISPTRYYQLLSSLIDRPEALAHDPMLVKRLQRLRAGRRRQRTARKLGIQLDLHGQEL
ncbi:DUF3263 domain-containing protein [Allonocardiopsis opalescens]|uniref:Uncharacterized protein DUF3263 n=1 Tax=Allonocardiopsis opalescens TaxID=1144618 RepID=A0A2T0Q9Y7_9ACTN|nr:DUF3263 domain-containing protein [Allonocardiopsis opalescens]PRY00688.1 uncharacterized protein DUF3263 [Allonocardiopsis opalescens]